MSLKKIRLTLGRDEDFPKGSDQHGYEFVAPLDPEGHIDAEAWRHARDRCRVRRFWAGEADELGHLVHTRGRSWAFHYDLLGNDDVDEAGYKFDSHLFRAGEYVSIREQDGRMRTFRVATVQDLG